jgi:hypothetical protein
VNAVPAEEQQEQDSSSSSSNRAHLRYEWWHSLPVAERDKLQSLYDSNWLYQLDEHKRIAYLHWASTLYEFLHHKTTSDNGNNNIHYNDAHTDDHYRSMAPLLLRASFHAAGTYRLSDGSGGSNGGTIFQSAELDDGLNGCIAIATTNLTALLLDHAAEVSRSDALAVAGAVALDVMQFPRMDLIQVTGGRDDYYNGIDDDNDDGGGSIVYRDRLANPDHDPLHGMVKHYGLTLAEVTALAGGGHNFGAAHGKCSGYVGQWTATPLSWFGPTDPWTGAATPPTFFPDLLRDDWRWYEVCTFYNDTVHYTSIADPFANDGNVMEEEEENEEVAVHAIPLGCPMMQNIEPLLCEAQAMRGCDFVDGVYGLGESPCDIQLLQIRLKSDFFLKANHLLRPHAIAFANDPDLLAIEFANAYRKVMSLGLDRCGLNGHGCQTGTTCAPSHAATTVTTPDQHQDWSPPPPLPTPPQSKVCVLDYAHVNLLFNAANDDDSNNDDDDNGNRA